MRAWKLRADRKRFIDAFTSCTASAVGAGDVAVGAGVAGAGGASGWQAASRHSAATENAGRRRFIVGFPGEGTRHADGLGPCVGGAAAARHAAAPGTARAQATGVRQGLFP